MIYYRQKRGSPWINIFGAAERWLNQQENAREVLDNIQTPNTKWVVLMKFFNVKVKVVLDRQPLLGTRPLPPGCATFLTAAWCLTISMTTCVLTLYSCALRSAARPEHTGPKRYFKRLKTTPNSVPWWTGSGRKAFQWGVGAVRCLSNRVYEPERQKNNEIL